MRGRKYGSGEAFGSFMGAYNALFSTSPFVRQEFLWLETPKGGRPVHRGFVVAMQLNAVRSMVLGGQLRQAVLLVESPK